MKKSWFEKQKIQYKDSIWEISLQFKLKLESSEAEYKVILTNAPIMTRVTIFKILFENDLFFDLEAIATNKKRMAEAKDLFETSLKVIII